MLYPCNIGICLTPRTAAVFGLSLVAATSYYIARSVMAKNRKRGGLRPVRPTGLPAAAPRIAGTQRQTDGKSLATGPLADTAAPSPWEFGTRPETSPYSSPACTVPFAKPLTLPMDILKKCPKLHSAYENRLSELAAVSDDVGHVLVHYLHTGLYQSLEPKSTDTMSRQIYEFKTSIQAYGAARAYDLPDLMLQAEARIDKHGAGLSLPTLLEVARDAYPLLTQEDHWFLDYLRARIRPHLDAKSLLGSDVLDKIGGILSPNKILVKTVLELFCERIMSDIRAESVVFPTTETMSTSEHPSAIGMPPEPASLHMETTPILASGITADTRPGLVVVDFMSLPGPLAETGATTGFTAQQTTPLDVTNAIEPGRGDAVEDGPGFECEPEATTPVELQTGATTATGVQDVGELKCRHAVSVARREEKDPGFGNDPELQDTKPISSTSCIPEPAPEPTPQVHAHRRLLREADSGFWETPDIELQGPISQQTEMESAVLPLQTSARIFAELEPNVELTTLVGVDTHDEGDSAWTDKGNAMHQDVDADATPPTEKGPVLPAVQDRIPIPGAEHTPVSADNAAAGLMLDQGPWSNRTASDALEAGPSAAQSRDAETSPMTEKAEPAETPEPAPLTELRAGAKAASPDRIHPANNNQPAGSVEPTPAPPDFEMKHESVGEDGVQGGSVNTPRAGYLPAPAANGAESLASHNANLKPMPDLGRAKTNNESANVQPCNHLARQRSWKKRFLSMRYPALFGRGM